jgi:NADPH:quinone reductase-like Zn-dependent oxidoreductase
MKAAVIYKLGDIPRYEDFPDPVLKDGEVTVKVMAVILDYAVKTLATGSHFASKQVYPNLPAVVGHTGIGSLEDGTLVSFRGIKPPYGSMAEKVAVPKAYATPIPQEITIESRLLH